MSRFLAAVSRLPVLSRVAHWAWALGAALVFPAYGLKGAVSFAYLVAAVLLSAVALGHALEGSCTLCAPDPLSTADDAARYALPLRHRHTSEAYDVYALGFAGLVLVLASMWLPISGWVIAVPVAGGLAWVAWSGRVHTRLVAVCPGCRRGGGNDGDPSAPDPDPDDGLPEPTLVADEVEAWLAARTVRKGDPR